MLIFSTVFGVSKCSVTLSITDLVPVLFRPPKISHDLICDRIRCFRGERAATNHQRQGTALFLVLKYSEGAEKSFRFNAEEQK